MKATWRVYVPYGVSTQVQINSLIDYYSASHYLTDKTAKVYLDSTPATLYVSNTEIQSPSCTIDLNIMALDPIGVNTNSAVVGFIPSRFIPLPQSSSGPAPAGFKTIAVTNDLLIEDTTSAINASYPTTGASPGFSVSQAYLSAAWSSTSTKNYPYQITLYFKVTDSVSDYTLYLKHGTTTATGVQLTIVVNQDPSNTNPDQAISITKYVTATEAEGGESNILSIALRDLEFASVDYHDYLQLGLNSVTITMAPMPIDGNYPSDPGYQIRAVSIEKG